MPWGMVAPYTDDDASISGLKADFPIWVDDDAVNKTNEVNLKLKDEVVDADIFANLHQAYEEGVHSYLDEANEVELKLEDEIAVVEIWAVNLGEISARSRRD
ncbi:hypothetical protein Tco_0498267, partial [Tanacetum coccineum]